MPDFIVLGNHPSPVTHTTKNVCFIGQNHHFKTTLLLSLSHDGGFPNTIQTIEPVGFKCDLRFLTQ